MGRPNPGRCATCRPLQLSATRCRHAPDARVPAQTGVQADDRGRGAHPLALKVVTPKQEALFVTRRLSPAHRSPASSNTGTPRRLEMRVLVMATAAAAGILWVGVSAQQEMLPKPGPG